MQSAKAILLKRTRTSALAAIFLTTGFIASAQSNSPYSRYGLGDLLPQNNITTRGMGGISAGYADMFSINFNNPASFGSFQSIQEAKTKKQQAGRMVLDVGINLENRTLIAPNTPQSFTSSDALFNYVQIGFPIRRNWGIAFGLRPISKVSYRIDRYERLMNPNPPGGTIDSALTEFSGSGGSFLPTIGTGFTIGRLSVGANMGYFFGRREIDTRRILLNDSVAYNASSSTNNYSFGGLHFQGGLQYLIDFKGNKFLRLGASGNWKQTVNGSRDLSNQTYVLAASGETIRVDSVFEQTDIKGQVVLPAAYTFGFVLGHYDRGWMLGADYTTSQWSQYRFFGAADSVQNGWKLAVGGTFVPRPGRGYFTNVAYRAGFGIGEDYVRVQQALPLFSASVGVSLPIRISRVAPNQINRVNLAFEFSKRGNNDNLLRENLYRLSIGFSLSDYWFTKRKYD
jgi:hypothetical protein